MTLLPRTLSRRVILEVAPEGFYEQLVITVPALLALFGVYPVAHWVQVVAVEQTAQLAKQGWH